MTPEQAETIKDLAKVAIEEAYLGVSIHLLQAEKNLMDAIDALTTESHCE